MAPEHPPMDPRRDELHDWLAEVLPAAGPAEPASSDASFRRYFRTRLGDGTTRIVMDAPPAREDCRPFLDIARRLGAAGVHVPAVLAADVGRGFLLLEDLGSVSYLSVLDAHSVGHLYADALQALLAIQGADVDGLAPYDRRRLRFEMELFPEWYLGRHLGADPAPLRGVLDHMFALLEEAALDQPQAFVHRDYHSRNLMVCAAGNPGVIDFQDAVRGPVTYDLVSLLRDCYIAWPAERVREWALEYRRRLRALGRAPGRTERDFLQAFDWMGLQRHIKVAGIFARLNHRDGKPGYLADIPLTLSYARSVCGAYGELAPLAELLDGLPVAGRAAAGA